MKPSNPESIIVGITFCKYRFEAPGADKCRAFFDGILDFMHEIGRPPTHWAVSKPTGPDSKYKPFRGDPSKYRKKLSDDVVDLSFVSVPTPEGWPAYDATIEINMSYMPCTPDALVGISAQCDSEADVEDLSRRFLRHLATVEEWDYGYAFVTDKMLKAGVYIAGGGTDGFTELENQNIEAWYNTPSEVRERVLRDIYPVNFLGSRLLSVALPSGRSLEEYARSCPGTEFQENAGGELAMWTVPESRRPEIRAELGAAGLVVSK